MTVITLAPFGQLPAVHLTAADGAQAIVTLYGAHLVSWKSAGGSEHLFCSARSALDGSKAIRAACRSSSRSLTSAVPACGMALRV